MRARGWNARRGLARQRVVDRQYQERTQSQIAGLSSDKFGAVAFDAKKLVQYVQASGLVNRSVAIEFQMQSQGTTPIWTATGTINVYVGSN